MVVLQKTPLRYRLDRDIESGAILGGFSDTIQSKIGDNQGNNTAKTDKQRIQLKNAESGVKLEKASPQRKRFVGWVFSVPETGS